jgi:hypothetical protein
VTVIGTVSKGLSCCAKAGIATTAAARIASKANPLK